MKLNVGQTDRYIRMAVAAVLVALVLFGVVTGVAAIIASVVAVVFIATATVKVCPLYMPFGIKTNKE
ncbi:DUF2892 domain-containing protein [Reinekea sp.]|jgi:hypothetical protein|uniref:YgaP family membrane protein n=1 Tax=Reinekea sp. TaxID=1970455 RepID=UPI0039890EB9